MKIIQLDEFYEKKTKIRESFLTNFWYFSFRFRPVKLNDYFPKIPKNTKKMKRLVVNYKLYETDWIVVEHPTEWTILTTY